MVVILHFLEDVTHLGQEGHLSVQPLDLLLDPAARDRVPLLLLRLRLTGGRPFLRIGRRLVRRKVLRGHHIAGKDGFQVSRRKAILNRQLVAVDIRLAVAVLDRFIAVLACHELKNLFLLSVVVLDLLEPLHLLRID